MSSATQWDLAAEPPETAVLVRQGIAPRTAALLARRGIHDAADAERFFAPAPAALHDPFLLHGMKEAVERLRRSRLEGERVVIVGDYDVDGVSGTALLLAVLRACEIDAEAILPNRLSDGYGFQSAQVRRAVEAGAKLIVTVDCGTTSFSAIAEAAAAGIDVIVTDHHIPPTDRAPEALQINPLQTECHYPYEGLSGAGLAFKLADGLLRHQGRQTPLDALLRVACLGTIADLVPLTGENRVIAALGLEALASARSQGLRALMRLAKVRAPVRAADVGFRLGPRLNAAGRLKRPDEALELLLTRDPRRAAELARELEVCNTERRETESRIAEEARGQFLERDPLPGFLLGWSAEWHRGVVGIAASRIASEFHRPTVLLAVEGQEATGSGRSIPQIELHEFLSRWTERFERFGGHSHAIGLTVRTSELESLRGEIEAAADWPPDALVRRRRYELELQPADIGDKLFEELERFQPHGQANQQPVIRMGSLQLDGEPRIFGDGHVSVAARGEDGAQVSLLGWRWEDRLDLLADRFEILARLDWDSYVNAPVLELRSARPSA